MRSVHPSEHQIQNSLLQYMAYFDIKAWRNNSGMLSVGEGSRRRIVRMGTAGMPDILGVLGKSYGRYFGRLFAVEVKVPGNKPTDIQERTIGELRQFGANVFVLHSIEELEDVVIQLRKEGHEKI